MTPWCVSSMSRLKTNIRCQSKRESHTYCSYRNEEETDQAFANRLSTVTTQLDDGVDFADVARRYRTTSVRQRWAVSLGSRMAPRFQMAMEDAIAELVLPGDISAPVETDAGTHYHST